MKVESISDIPDRATIREEYVRCSNRDCIKLHGPYMYAYWKDNGKIVKVYIGKSMKHLEVRLEAEKFGERWGLSRGDARRLKFINDFSLMGDQLAKKYGDMAIRKECSVSWAFRIVSLHHRDVIERMIEAGLDPADNSQVASYLTRVLGNSKRL